MFICWLCETKHTAPSIIKLDKTGKAPIMISRAEQSRAEQSRAEQSRAEQSRAEQSRAEQSRAEQSRAEQSRAEQSRAECSIPCNLCGSRIVEILSLKDRKGDYLRTIICKKCGLIWSDPRPADEKIKEFYSKEYRKEYKGLTKPKKKHVYRDAKEAIKRYNYFKEILSKDDSVLDIGAGNGVFVYTLCQSALKIDPPSASKIDPPQAVVFSH